MQDAWRNDPETAWLTEAPVNATQQALKNLEAGLVTALLVATRGRAEGLIFNIDGLIAPSKVKSYAPRLERLSTCDEAVKAALHYPAGLNAAGIVQRRETAGRFAELLLPRGGATALLSRFVPSKEKAERQPTQSDGYAAT